MCVRTNTYTHSVVRQTNQLPQGLLACEKGQGALLFSLWFSYYTQINTVELFWRPGALDPERASTDFFSLSLFLSQSPYLPLFHCLSDRHTHTRTWCYALIQALPNKQVNKHIHTLLMHLSGGMCSAADKELNRTTALEQKCQHSDNSFIHTHLPALHSYTT